MRRLAHILCAGWVLVTPAPGLGDGPKPFPDFTFRRIGVPDAGAGRRITVQIDPTARPASAAESEDAAASEPAAPAAWDWFWQAVSPAAGEAGPANLARALAALAARPDMQRPRLQALQDIAGAHGRTILGATVGSDVSPALVLAVISVESAGRSDAESTAGARGLMQLIPATAARFGVGDSSDPAQNIAGGVAYLGWLLDHFAGDPILALAGYNAGENAVHDHAGVPPYAETRAYVPKVLAAWQVARGLCLTPPELMSDGCVFAIERTATND